MIEVQFEIIRPIKGAEDSKHASVFTTYQCCACGFGFKINTTYVVYANSYMAAVIKDKTLAQSEAELQKLFVNPIKISSTSTCMRTTEHYDVELEKIDTFLKSQRDDRR